jgi:hypothetical protein
MERMTKTGAEVSSLEVRPSDKESLSCLDLGRREKYTGPSN